MLFPGRRVSFITTQPQQQIVFLPCTHTTKPVPTPLSPYPHHWARIRTTEPIPTPPSPYPHHWACTHTTEHAPISSFSYLPHPVIPIAHYYHRRVSEVNDQLLRTWGFYFKPQGREPCLLTSTEPQGRGKNWRGLRFSLMCFQLSPPQGSWKKLSSSLSRSAKQGSSSGNSFTFLCYILLKCIFPKLIPTDHNKSDKHVENGKSWSRPCLSSSRSSESMGNEEGLTCVNVPAQPV